MAKRLQEELEAVKHDYELIKALYEEEACQHAATKVKCATASKELEALKAKNTAYVAASVSIEALKSNLVRDQIN